MIIEEADRLRNLVDRMLGSNKLPSLAMTNVHEVLERVCNLVEAETQGSITLVRDYDPSLPDLLIELVSPSGTRSVLLNPNNSLVGQSLDRQQLGYVRTKGLRDMRMLSHKFYGEAAQGEWRLEVTDVSNSSRQLTLVDLNTNRRSTLTERNNSQPGQLLNWSLRVIGHDATRL